MRVFTRQFTLFSLLFASGVIYALPDFNLTQGVTPVSHDIYDLHMTVFWVCVGIGAVVFGTMIYIMINHRKSLGVKAAQFHEKLWLEIVWTIIPFCILIALAVPGTRVLMQMRDESQPDLTIKITGFQWKWKYEYLDNGVQFFSNLSTPFPQRMGNAPKGDNYLREVDHPLVVPIHKKIRLLVTSNDVIHAWWVPELGVKQDAVPGFINENWTRINRPGTYRGQCAELCGMNHAFMPIVVIAMTQSDYDAWVAQQKGIAAPSMPAATVQPANSAMGATAKPPVSASSAAQPTTPATTTQPTQPTTAPAATQATQPVAATTTTQPTTPTAAAATTQPTTPTAAAATTQPTQPAAAISAPQASQQTATATAPQTTQPAVSQTAPPAAQPASATTANAAPSTSTTAKQYTLDELIAKGKSIFLNTCAACHQPDGSGMPPTFPNLITSQVVNGPVAKHIHTVVFGVTGTAMQAFGQQFNPDDIAAVITYERNEVGHQKGDIVQPADIIAAEKAGESSGN